MSMSSQYCRSDESRGDAKRASDRAAKGAKVMVRKSARSMTMSALKRICRAPLRAGKGTSRDSLRRAYFSPSRGYLMVIV
jgi:hypothetical protein